MQKLTILTGGWLLLALACPGAERPTKQEDRSGGIVVSEAAPQTFDFSFPGGTMTQFVAAVKGAYVATWTGRPGSAPASEPNLVLPASASTVEVPPLELRGVDLKSLLEAVGRLLPRGPVWTRVGESTWVLQSVPDRRETRVFYVGNLLTKFKIDDISTALTTTWDMWDTGGGSKPELKYHKDTELLIIHADKAHLEVAQNVLAQLREAWLLGSGADPTKAPKGR